MKSPVQEETERNKPCELKLKVKNDVKLNTEFIDTTEQNKEEGVRLENCRKRAKEDEGRR